ncbi:hypothetical protein LT493_44395 [Streptomyces tricolor]|nr:hypothetical protein [Streptomyces tricolor]
MKVATAWGASYNAVVGAGDLTGDGKADLVARATPPACCGATARRQGPSAPGRRSPPAGADTRGLF